MSKHSPASWGSLIPGQTFVVTDKGGMPCWREAQHQRAKISSGLRITVLEPALGSEDVRTIAEFKDDDFRRRFALFHRFDDAV